MRLLKQVVNLAEEKQREARLAWGARPEGETVIIRPMWVPGGGAEQEPERGYVQASWISTPTILRLGLTPTRPLAGYGNNIVGHAKWRQGQEHEKQG